MFKTAELSHCPPCPAPGYRVAVASCFKSLKSEVEHGVFVFVMLGGKSLKSEVEHGVFVMLGVSGAGGWLFS